MIEVIGSKKYKKVYLSGPITGRVNLNIDEFQKYENKFKELNFEVINPHKLHSKEEVDEINSKLASKEITEKEAWVIFMKKDLPEMILCNFIAVLNDWEKSKGANLEVYVARNLEMPIICAVTLKELF